MVGKPLDLLLKLLLIPLCLSLLPRPLLLCPTQLLSLQVPLLPLPTRLLLAPPQLRLPVTPLPPHITNTNLRLSSRLPPRSLPWGYLLMLLPLLVLPTIVQPWEMEEGAGPRPIKTLPLLLCQGNHFHRPKCNVLTAR